VLALAFAITDVRRGSLLVFLIAAGGVFSWWGQQVRAFTSPCTVESDYFCIRTDDFSAQSGRPSALMALDHLVHSINDRDDPGFLYSPYIHGVDELAKLRFRGHGDGFSPRAYFIGGGGYSLPRAWASDYENADLVVAEIDPQVTLVAARDLWLDVGAPGLRIHHRDARTLLQSLDRNDKFDLIFGDAFRDISIPAHLVTREFHREIAARLAPTGFYAVNVVDSGRHPLFLFSLLKTLKRDFPITEVWIEAEEVGNPGRVTYIVIASATPTPSRRITSARGPSRTWIRWPTADLAVAVRNADVPVLSDDFAPVDRLMSHLLLRPE
ncbi:MAG: fused MFS/spermidine synthase, partial [Alphaproteobacteria bacterium]